MNVLVLNSGSSTLKFQLIATDLARIAQNSDEHLCRGQIEWIGGEAIITVQTGNGPRQKFTASLSDIFESLEYLVRWIASGESGITEVGSPSDIHAVGHRVVHGGELFTESTVITDKVLKGIEQCIDLAPLHNPNNIKGILASRQVFGPNLPQVAVFDTSFHHSIPEHAYLYAVPFHLYRRHHIRRYGFHGTSHRYVADRYRGLRALTEEQTHIITLHLGNGCSATAICGGRSVDTSMGMTPLEGLVMGTRSGDIDPGLPAFLERSEKLSAAQIEELLNRKSGLLGLSGVSNDMREILKAADEGKPRSLVALKAYCYRVRKYLGAYVAAMGGLDVVIFTGGVGQGSAEVRALALQGLECMGITLDAQRNRDARGFEEVCRISTDDSKATVLIVPTDEERMMAREALRALSRSYIAKVLEVQKRDPFLVEVSAHHIHLTQEHVEALFGKGHQLTKHADLSQPGQFACKEQVTVVGPKGRIERVRVLGPTRPISQVEIAMTEQFKLGVQPPVRESGDIKDTPGCTLEGLAGSVKLERGVICALRHVHMTPEDALRYGVRDKALVRVRIAGDRELVFGDVLVRVDPKFALAMHIDTDEANAANVQTGAQGFIDGIQEEA